MKTVLFTMLLSISSSCQHRESGGSATLERSQTARICGFLSVGPTRQLGEEFSSYFIRPNSSSTRTYELGSVDGPKIPVGQRRYLRSWLNRGEAQGLQVYLCCEGTYEFENGGRTFFFRRGIELSAAQLQEPITVVTVAEPLEDPELRRLVEGNLEWGIPEHDYDAIDRGFHGKIAGPVTGYTIIEKTLQGETILKMVVTTEFPARVYQHDRPTDISGRAYCRTYIDLTEPERSLDSECEVEWREDWD